MRPRPSKLRYERLCPRRHVLGREIEERRGEGRADEMLIPECMRLNTVSTRRRIKKNQDLTVWAHT